MTVVIFSVEPVRNANATWDDWVGWRDPEGAPVVETAPVGISPDLGRALRRARVLHDHASRDGKAISVGVAVVHEVFGEGQVVGRVRNVDGATAWFVVEFRDRVSRRFEAGDPAIRRAACTPEPGRRA